MSHFSIHFGQFLPILLQSIYEQSMDIDGLHPSIRWYGKCSTLIAKTKLVEAFTLCSMLSAPGLLTRKELVCFFVGFLVDWGNLIQG